MRYLPPPLRLSIPTLLLVVGIVLQAFSLSHELRQSRQRVRDRMAERARLLGTILAGQIESTFRAGESRNTRNLVSYAMADRELRSATLVSEHGIILFSSQYELDGRPIQQSPLAPHASLIAEARQVRSSLLEKGPTLLVGAFPVLLHTASGDLLPSHVGVLVLEYDLAVLEGQARQAAVERVFWNGLMLAITCGGLWVLFRWLLLGRVARLVDATRRLSAGDLEARVELSGTDELASLARAFNAMSRNLETSSRELRASEMRMRRVVESNVLGIFFWSADGAITDANDAFLELLGYGREELAAGRLRWPELTPPEYRAQDERMVRQVLVNGACRPFEKEFFRKDGARVPVLIGAATLENEPGRGLAFVTDLSARKHAERERVRLLKQEQRARATAEYARRRSDFLAEASKCLSASLDVEAAFQGVAKLSVDFLATWFIADIRTNGDAVRRIAVMCADPSRAALASALAAAAPARSSPAGWPTRARLVRDGVTPTLVSDELGLADASLRAGVAELGIRAFCSVPMVVQGRTLGVITLLYIEPEALGPDALVTAEELASRAGMALRTAHLYREAQEAIRVRDEFLSIASHELRTPCTSLKLGIQRLLQMSRRPDSPIPPLVTKALEGADRQTKRLSILIDQLLDASRIVSGRLVLSLELVDLVEVIRRVASNLENELARSGSPLSMNLPPSAIGYWDPERLEQVVGNLLGNAVKYGAGNPIELDLEVDDEIVILRVRDHGIGIPPERQARIFDRFERAVSTRHYGGFGLGLYIVRTVVEELGGHIDLRSVPGEGSTFTVVLQRNTSHFGLGPDVRGVHDPEPVHH